MIEESILPVDPIEQLREHVSEDSDLDEIKREPGSFLEKFLDYSDAEAIQTFFTSLVTNLAAAFKDAFTEYLEEVNAEPEAFAAELAEPVLHAGAMGESEAAETIKDHNLSKVIGEDTASDKLESSASADVVSKAEQTILGEHTVTDGDMLSTLALQYYGRAELWPLIHEANRDIIGDNPGRIYPGQELEIPALESGAQPVSLTLAGEALPAALSGGQASAALRETGTGKMSETGSAQAAAELLPAADEITPADAVQAQETAGLDGQLSDSKTAASPLSDDSVSTPEASSDDSTDSEAESGFSTDPDVYGLTGPATAGSSDIMGRDDDKAGIIGRDDSTAGEDSLPLPELPMKPPGIDTFPDFSVEITAILDAGQQTAGTVSIPFDGYGNHPESPPADYSEYGVKGEHTIQF